MICCYKFIPISQETTQILIDFRMAQLYMATLDEIGCSIYLIYGSHLANCCLGRPSNLEGHRTKEPGWPTELP